MLIEQINKSTLKITLHPRDLNSLDISYDRLSRTDAGTHRFLRELLQIAHEKTGFDFQNRLTVQVSQTADGSCEIFFSSDGSSDCDIFMFPSSEKLRDFCGRLSPDDFLQSILFSCGGRWFLSLRSPSPAVVHLLGESCAKRITDEDRAFLEEHGKQMIPENAVAVINRCF